jgi:peptidoglycan/xylan/chitin deacetylase (PgdA/CDA1 family)
MKLRFIIVSIVALALAPTHAFAQEAQKRPNELGRIPIIMYHSIGDRGAYDKRGLNISPATFRKHLEMMYKANWYPINARDIFLPEKLQAVPAGKTPVAITFDDARGSQFKYLKDGQIDPNCGVGILEAFHQEHPNDWPQRATFWVLPKSKYNPTPFWQEGKEKQKVQFLLQNGYEVSNHSTKHHSLGPMGAAELKFEVTTCTQFFRKIDPNVQMDTFCLPYGVAPKNKSLWPILLSSGPSSPYRNLGVFMAWGDESYSPYDKRFNKLTVTRIGVDPNYFEATIKRIALGGKDAKFTYISDGNSSVVTTGKDREKYVNTAALGSMRVSYYEVSVPKSKQTPVKKTVIAKKTAKS